MESFNKTLVVSLAGLASLVWLAAVVVALFFFQGAVDLAASVVNFLVENSGLYLRLMFAALFAIFLMVSLLLILVEYTPRTPGAVALPQVSGGIALLTTQAIAQQIKLALADLSGVTQVQPRVTPRGRLLDIALELHATAGTDLVHQTSEVQERLQRAVEGELGLRLGRLRIFYHLEAPATS